MYIFDTHYGKSSLADDKTGIVIEWTNGAFNETQKVLMDPSAIAISVPEGEELASFLARKMREMGDYIAENYPETI